MNWISSIIRQWVQPSRPRNDLTPDLGLMRLEPRRVLNGDGVVSELVVDAGMDGDDGQADVFDVEINGQQIEVSRNGTLIESVSSDRFDSVRLVGSSDDDSFRVRVDQTAGAIDVGVEGGDGQNVLQLQSLDRIEQLIHALEDSDSGVLSFSEDANLSSVEYDGISQVDQQFLVGRLTYEFASGEDQVTVNAKAGIQSSSTSSSGTELVITRAGELGSSESMVISFFNPTEQLILNADSNAGADQDQFFLNGLGDSFDADFLFQGDELDRLNVIGDIQVGGNNIHIASGEVDIQSTIFMDGGDFEAQAGRSIELSESGSIINRSGNVVMESEVDTTVSGTIDVSGQSRGFIGGQIKLLGSSVTVTPSGRLDASGDVGGGEILLGGDFQGKNTDIRNAVDTRVERNAQIRADGLRSGPGGRVIVWSDHRTEFLGNITTRGGEERGDGGFVEVSGKQLSFDGFVDVAAIQGNSGQILIDPINIVIGSGSDANTSYIAAASLVSMLQSGPVTLQADNDISIDDGF
ncbi:MAG: hypothetical protein AAFV88_23700, partial [Planctomycetota bacterium]